MRRAPIDWDKCLELVKGNKALAKELLVLFVAQLPEAQEKIQSAYHTKKYQVLAEQLHKLYGACCYCSVPKLTTILNEWRAAMEAKQWQGQETLSQLFDEAVLHIHKEYTNLLESGVLE